MTLVVARRFNDGIRVVGDTRLTDAYGTPRLAVHHGALKVVIAAPDLCVAYAGENLVAREALKDLGAATGGRPGLEDATRHLRRPSREGATFVIASLTPVPSLTHIEAGEVTSGESSFHAGDSRAFNAYQRAYLGQGHVDASACGPSGAMTGALRRVIDDDSVPAVGGFATEVRTGPRGFLYTGGGVIQTGPVAVGPGTSDADPDEGWWDASQGAYGHKILTPDAVGIGALGVHFPHPRLGILYCPLASENPYIYRNVSDGEFRLAVYQHHAITLGGARIDAVAPRTFMLADPDQPPLEPH